jgi:hypothetical protein
MTSTQPGRVKLKHCKHCDRVLWPCECGNCDGYIHARADHICRTSTGREVNPATYAEAADLTAGEIAQVLTHNLGWFDPWDAGNPDPERNEVRLIAAAFADPDRDVLCLASETLGRERLVSICREWFATAEEWLLEGQPADSDEFAGCPPMFPAVALGKPWLRLQDAGVTTWTVYDERFDGDHVLQLTPAGTFWDGDFAMRIAAGRPVSRDYMLCGTWVH